MLSITLTFAVYPGMLLWLDSDLTNLLFSCDNFVIQFTSVLNSRVKSKCPTFHEAFITFLNFLWGKVSSSLLSLHFFLIQTLLVDLMLGFSFFFFFNNLRWLFFKVQDFQLHYLWKKFILFNRSFLFLSMCMSFLLHLLSFNLFLKTELLVFRFYFLKFHLLLLFFHDTIL